MRSVVSFRASGQSVDTTLATDWPEAPKRDNRSHTPLETIDCSTTMSLYRLTCRTKSLPMRDDHLPGSVTWKRAPNSASLLVISVCRRDWCPTPFKSYKVTQVRSPCAPSCFVGRLHPTSELASSSSPLGADSVIIFY